MTKQTPTVKRREKGGDTVLRKKQVVTIVSIAVISFLTGTTLNVVTMATDGGNPFDWIWEAINDLQSETSELWMRLAELRTDHEDLRVEFDELRTDFIELETDYEEFKSNVTIALSREPDYDSGWIFSDGYAKTLYHNLGTDKVLVYLIGRNSLSEPITGKTQSGTQHAMCWSNLNTTHIDIFGRYSCKYVRVMIWIIQ